MELRDKLAANSVELNVEDIKITDRARVDLGDNFDDLKNSIARRGLMNPIIVSKEDMELVGGFRRLTAHKELGLQKIRVRFYEQLDALDKKLLELEENLHAPLTWWETAKLHYEIHTNCQAKYGKAERGRGKKGGWSVKDTAAKLGISVGAMSQSISLVEAQQTALPSIAEYATAHQAHNALNKAKEIAVLTELARREAQKGQSSKEKPVPYILKCGDAVSVLKSDLESETVSTVIFDPPWGIDIDRIATSRGLRGEKTSYADDSSATATKLTLDLLPEIYRVMKPDAHMYFFFGLQFYEFYYDLLTNYERLAHKMQLMIDTFPEAKEGLQTTQALMDQARRKRKWKFHVEVMPIIWVKEGGGFTDHEYKFMPRYEAIMFCSRENAKPLNKVASNVFVVNRPPTNARIHTQEKPVELIQELIEISSNKHEVVLDPCAGSFVTAVAATLAQRRSFCIDKDKTCFAKGLARVSGLTGDDEDDTDKD